MILPYNTNVRQSTDMLEERTEAFFTFCLVRIQFRPLIYPLFSSAQIFENLDRVDAILQDFCHLWSIIVESACIQVSYE